MPAPTVSAQQVFARITHHTGLLGDEYHRKRSLAPLISALGGIRSEKMDQAHLVLAARLPDYKPTRLLKELQERHSVVRTWGVRGLLQVISTSELDEFLAAAGASPRWRRFLEGKTTLSAKTRLRLLRKLCPEVITREALKDAFADSSMRLFLLREAAQAGHILWKDGDGAAASFAWTKNLLGRTVEPARDYHALVGRYLAAYGPLDAADLGSWLGVTVAAARQLMAKHRVIEIQVEGEAGTSFMRPADYEALRETRKSTARGLAVTAPGDPLVIAYKTRWRDPEGDEAPGLAFLDSRLVARWSLTRNEASITLLDESLDKRVHKAVTGLLERAGVQAELVAS